MIGYLVQYLLQIPFRCATRGAGREAPSGAGMVRSELPSPGGRTDGPSSAAHASPGMSGRGRDRDMASAPAPARDCVTLHKITQDFAQDRPKLHNFPDLGWGIDRSPYKKNF